MCAKNTMSHVTLSHLTGLLHYTRKNNCKHLTIYMTIHPLKRWLNCLVFLNFILNYLADFFHIDFRNEYFNFVEVNCKKATLTEDSQGSHAKFESFPFVTPVRYAPPIAEHVQLHSKSYVKNGMCWVGADNMQPLT